MTTKLLVADDSVTIQKVVALTFSDQNIVIETAMNGDEVFEKAMNMRPDIILADVFMPGRNGYEVCAQIKADPVLNRTPVVLLVGSFEPFDASEASRVGCDAHITKPFETTELRELVKTLVGKRTDAQNVDGTPVQPQTSFSPQSLRGGNLVSQRARESFLGSDRILDLLDPRTLASVAPSPVAAPAAPVAPEPAVSTPLAAAEPTQSSTAELSEQALDLIVERVIKRMSREVVREVAWEVIPEMSETILRQYIEEHGLQGRR